MNRRTLLKAGLSAGALVGAPGTALAQVSRGAFAAAQDYSAAHGPSGLLIVRQGVVMAESYVGADASTLWNLGSAGRMFAPMLAAALVEDRMLSLSEPVALTLGDWGADPVKNTITMRALLNGSSAIGSDHRGDLALQDAIALQPLAQPGQRFVDDPAPYLIFGEIVRRKLLTRGASIDVASYLNLRVLDDIHCTPVNWARTQEGNANLSDGMQTTLLAWAQAGELIRRSGIYRAQQVVDADAMREALQGSFAERRAGMGFWLTAGVRGDAPDMRVQSDLWRTTPAPPLDLAMAAGQDGQRMYIAPSEGLLVVRGGRDGGNWSDAAFLGAIMAELY